MWTRSACCWILLLSLIVVVIDSTQPAVTCCTKYNRNKFHFTHCLEQNRPNHCSRHAYKIKVVGGGWKCINPNATWIQEELKKKGITCRPDVELIKAANFKLDGWIDDFTELWN